MVFSEVACSTCGARFRYPQDYGVVRYCSADCRVRSQPPVHPWEYKGCTSNKYYSPRRRRKMKAGDKIDPLVIYIVFDWTCWLCNDRIDPALRLPDDRSATLDHIVPLDLDGKHVWENLRPAHKCCNEDKDNEIYEESVNSQ